MAMVVLWLEKISYKSIFINLLIAADVLRAEVWDILYVTIAQI